MTNTIQMIPVDLIDPHPDNPRRDVGNVTELAASIRAQGIRQNLLVVPKRHCADSDCDLPDRYTAVIGHRRLAAAKKAKLTKVPAAVAELGAAEQVELMLLENVQRQDLSAVEEAEGYQDLLDLGMDVAAIAKATGRAAKTVTARVKLLSLPEVAREKVHAHQATLEDAAKLADLDADEHTLAQLSDALGTSNFQWRLGEAKREQHRIAEQDKLVAAAVELGATEIRPDDPDRPDLYGDGWVSRRVQKVEDLGASLPVGTVIERGSWSTTIELGIPDPDGQTRSAEQAAAKAAREASAAEQQRARDEWDAAAKLREAWVREYVARAKVSAAHTEAILAASAPRVLEGNLWSHSAGKAWTSVTMRPVCCLLVALLVECTYSRWDNTRLHQLYDLLATLGYQPSDVELARLAEAKEAE